MPTDVIMLCCDKPHSQCECLMSCDECEMEFPGKNMYDTLVGVLCPKCAQPFVAAALSLASRETLPRFEDIPE